MLLNCNRSWHAATSTKFSGCKDHVVVVNGGLVWNKQKDCLQGLPLSELLVFKEQEDKIEAELLTLIVNETLCLSDHSLIIFKDQIIMIGGMSAPDAFSQPEHSHDIFIFTYSKRMLLKRIHLPEEYSSAECHTLFLPDSSFMILGGLSKRIIVYTYKPMNPELCYHWVSHF